jgi:XRE family aerobic/anaerobic benzoate catabolism transcriptional regulator
MSGLATFRRYERMCLERVIAEHAAAVIATAGGIVSNPETYALLLRRTHTIWIKARPDEHMGRVMAQGDFRPMAQDRRPWPTSSPSSMPAARIMRGHRRSSIRRATRRT